MTVANLGSAGNTPDAIAAGAQHSCAPLLDATVQCWGLAYGAVGDGSDGSVTYRLSLGTVVGLAPAASGINTTTASLTAATTPAAPSCLTAVSAAGDANEFGQGGHGGTYQTTPQYVAAPGCALDIDGDGVAMLGSDGLLLGARPRSAQRQRGHAIGHGHRWHRQTWFAQWQHLTARCGVTGLSPEGAFDANQSPSCQFALARRLARVSARLVLHTTMGVSLIAVPAANADWDPAEKRVTDPRRNRRADAVRAAAEAKRQANRRCASSWPVPASTRTAHASTRWESSHRALSAP